LTPERLGGASEAVVVALKRRFDRFVDSAGWIFCLLVMLSPAAAPPHLAASPRHGGTGAVGLSTRLVAGVFLYTHLACFVMPQRLSLVTVWWNLCDPAICR